MLVAVRSVSLAVLRHEGSMLGAGARSTVNPWLGRPEPGRSPAVAGLASADARQPLQRREAEWEWQPVDAAGWLVTGPDPLAPRDWAQVGGSRSEAVVPRRSRTSVEARAGRPWVRAGGRSCRGCRERPSR